MLNKHRTRWWGAVLGGISALSLVGCAALPTAGPVNDSEVRVGMNQPLLGLSAPGPVPNATVEQIVTGFIRACSAGYSDDFTVARSFLAPKAAIDWRPDVQVEIFDTDSALETRQLGDGSVEVTARALGSVDEHGNYTVAGPSERVRTVFSLVKPADNQWRIAALEDGVMLSQSAFSSIYASAPVYFLTNDAGALVPDLRWYPRRRLPTYLVNALLAGPQDAFKGAVRSAFPTGSTLAGGAVDVFDGVANVSLNVPDTLNDPTTINLAYWQIESTLRDVSGISTVSLSIGKVPLENTNPITQSTTPQFPIMVKDGNVVRLNSGATEVLVPAGAVASGEITNPAISTAGDEIVFTDSSYRRLYLWARGAATQLYSGRELLAASIDRNGWIWTLDTANPRQVIALHPDGTRMNLEVPWETGDPVRTFTISPDGTRVAFVRHVGQADIVSVAVVIRDGSGTPRSFSAPVTLQAGNEVVSEIAWLQGDSLVLLTGSGDNTTVRIAPLFGPVSTLPGVKNAVDLAAGEEENQIYLITTGGDLYKRSGRNWQQVLNGVADPSYPG